MILLVSVLGCSRVPVVPCSTAPEVCPLAFGTGTVCGESGYCEPSSIHPRCTTEGEFPLQAGAMPIATVFDHSIDAQRAGFQASRLAIAQNTGIDGREFVGIHCDVAVDDTYDQATTQEATVELTEWVTQVLQVPVIVGASESWRAEEMVAITSTERVLLISPSATSPALGELDGGPPTDDVPGLFWRTTPTDDVQGAAIAQDMRQVFDPAQQTAFRVRPSQRVAVVHQTSTYGTDLAASFRVAFEQAGGEVVEHPFADVAQLELAVAAAGEDAADEVLFVSEGTVDIITFLQAVPLVDALVGTPLFLTDVARNPDVLQAARAVPEVIPRLRGSSPAAPSGSVYDDFASAFTDAYEVEVTEPFTAHSYDATWLATVAYARNIVGYIPSTGTNLSRTLLHVSSGAEAPVGPASWGVVLDAFVEGEGVDVVGASGPLDFREDGELGGDVSVWVIDPDDGFVDVDRVSIP